MNGFKPPALFLVASFGTLVHAVSPPEIKIELTQLNNPQCAGVLANNTGLLSGDCITYRITVENIGGQTAHNVEVSAMIPEHTELYHPIRNIHSRERLGTVVEHKTNGSSVIKAAIDSVPAGGADTIVLEYSVRVI